MSRHLVRGNVTRHAMVLGRGTVSKHGLAWHGGEAACNIIGEEATCNIMGGEATCLRMDASTTEAPWHSPCASASRAGLEFTCLNFEQESAKAIASPNRFSFHLAFYSIRMLLPSTGRCVQRSRGLLGYHPG